MLNTYKYCNDRVMYASLIVFDYCRTLCTIKLCTTFENNKREKTTKIVFAQKSNPVRVLFIVSRVSPFLKPPTPKTRKPDDSAGRFVFFLFETRVVFRTFFADNGQLRRSPDVIRRNISALRSIDKSTRLLTTSDL